MNEERVGFGIIGALLSSMINELEPLFICVLIFILSDLITGIWRSKVVAERNNEAWGIEAKKLYRTLYKTIFIFLGIFLCWLLNTTCFPNMDINLSKLFCGFACAFEMWSFLENAAVISEHPVFKMLQKFMKKQLKDKGIET